MINTAVGFTQNPWLYSRTINFRILKVVILGFLTILVYLIFFGFIQISKGSASEKEIAWAIMLLFSYCMGAYTLVSGSFIIDVELWVRKYENDPEEVKAVIKRLEQDIRPPEDN